MSCQLLRSTSGWSQPCRLLKWGHGHNWHEGVNSTEMRSWSQLAWRGKLYWNEVTVTTGMKGVNSIRLLPILDRSTSNSVTRRPSPTRRVHRGWIVGRPQDIESLLWNKPANWRNKQSQTKLAVLLPGWGVVAGGPVTPKKCLRCPLTGSSANMGRYKP